MHRIVIVDYGMGNLRSVQKGFERVGATAEISRDPAELAKADKLVLPGVGAFRDAMAELQRCQLIEPLLEAIRRDKPFLGICLGLQLLFDVSYEGEECRGLGVIPGKVVRFDLPRGFKVPHMGWNQAILAGPLRYSTASRTAIIFTSSTRITWCLTIPPSWRWTPITVGLSVP